jgi:hypothetical protein
MEIVMPVAIALAALRVVLASAALVNCRDNFRIPRPTTDNRGKYTLQRNGQR